MRRWFPVIVLAAGQFVMVLDSTVMNVSISTVVADLNTTVPLMQLAIACYTLVMASLMLTGASLGRRWGGRRAYTVGLGIYAVGSLTTALAPNFVVLFIGWSVIEGLGAVLVIPAIVSLAAANYTGRDRAIAYGIIGGVAGAGAAAGPLIGGWVTSTFTWRVVFVAEVVIVLVILATAAVVRDGPRDRDTGNDLVGTGLSALSLGLIVVALVESTTWGWVEPRRPPFELAGFSPTVPMILAGLAAGWCFLNWERSRTAAGRPVLVDPALLEIPFLRSGLSSLMVQQFVIAGTFFALPLYLQVVLGLDALGSGIRILPLSVALFVASFVGAARAAMTSPKVIVRVGLAVTSLGVLAALSTIDTQLRSVGFGISMAALGAGLGLVASQLGNVIQSSVDARHSAEAAGLQGTAQNLGASLGTALAGAILLGGLTAAFTAQLADQPTLRPEVAEQVAAQAEIGVPFITVGDVKKAARAAGLPDDQTDLLAGAYTEAQISALRAALGAVALVGLVGLSATRRLPDTPMGAGSAEEQPAAADAV